MGKKEFFRGKQHGQLLVVACGILGVCKLWFSAFPVSVVVCFCVFVCENKRVLGEEKGRPSKYKSREDTLKGSKYLLLKGNTQHESNSQEKTRTLLTTLASFLNAYPVSGIVLSVSHI